MAGLTLLLVEDSRFASEAIRLLSVRSGARVRRADCLTSAQRHLVVYNPTILIVDLCLPDGSGLELITTLAQSEHRPRILGTSGLADGKDLALKAGADGFLAKPVAHLASFQAVILACLPEEDRPKGPRRVVDEIVQPDRIALFDDLAHGADLLTLNDDPTDLEYAAQFIAGVAREAADSEIVTAAEDLLAALGQDAPFNPQKARLAAFLSDRLATRTLV